MFRFGFAGAILAMAAACAMAQGPTDPVEFGAFVDGAVEVAMDREGIPGTVVVAVKDGAVFFSKGYGFADKDAEKPVLPGDTLFRVASVSKLFTATAVMQLVEQGRIDMNADVNGYLSPLQLPATFSEPITMTHLLTHSAGFDDQAIGLTVRDWREVRPLEPFLSEHMPMRMRPAGEVIAYSNVGYVLAGLIVEKVSGEPFAEYVQRHILDPLGMSKSSFITSEESLQRLAVGYDDGGRPVIANFINDVPVGALEATGLDMAQFMIAHLNGGAAGEARILSPESTARMHERLFSHHPQMNGMCFSFFEDRMNGVRVLHHGGDLPGFASMLFLVPEANFGMFMSSNKDVDGVRGPLAKAIMDRYFGGEEEPSIVAAAADVQAAERAAGSYRSLRYSEKSIQKLTTLLEQFHATADDTGALMLMGNPTVRLLPQGDGLYASEKDGTRIRIEPRSDGRDRFYFSHGAFEKLHWYETTAAQVALILFMMGTYASVLILWPVLWFKERVLRRGYWMRRNASAAAVALLAVASNFLCMIGLAVGLLATPDVEFMIGVPPMLVLGLCLPFVSAVLLPFMAGWGVAMWRQGYWTLPRRLHYSVAFVAVAAFFPFAYYWNLLGFNW